MTKLRPYGFFWVAMLLLTRAAHSQNDSSTTLRNVTLTSLQKKNSFLSITPAQRLDRTTLFKLNAITVGDAARFFSGVQVKDYGGVGGLKTVSVRSLGASHTGILYDGITVADAQTGQTDLNRFSNTFIQSLTVQQAGPDQLLQPARAFASSAVLSINTTSFYPALTQKKELQAGLKPGSFGLWQPSLGLVQPLSKRLSLSANAEGLLSKGNYPFRIENGNRSEDATRENGNTRSLQVESNLTALFKDSSVLQAKVWGYASKRGLPGAIVFFNDRSVQTLRNQDYFGQLRYQKSLPGKMALLLSGKYNYSNTHYSDPDFLNGAGGLDNKYKQAETYAGVAVSKQLHPSLQLAVASDGAYSKLRADVSNFAFPSRFSLWNSLSLNYSQPLFSFHTNLLSYSVWDRTKDENAASSKNRLLPTLALSVRPEVESPWMLRVFYKQVFRIPSFNDLYYNFIGNSRLKPEWTRQYNAGLVYSKHLPFSSFSISADAYYNLVKDKIVAVPNRNLFVWTMLNLGTVKIKGVDLTTETNGRFSQQWTWLGRLAYTYQQATDNTDPSSSSYKDRIPYTPDHSGSGLMSLGYREWSAGYSFLFSGTRYVLGENNPSNQLNGWGVHDVFLSHNLVCNRMKVLVKAEINNLTGERYAIVRYYPMPGRSFRISLLLMTQ